MASTKQRPFPVFVGGRSGIGKTTALDALITYFPTEFRRPMSYTTRPRRSGEGQEYEFVSKVALAKLDRAGKLVNFDTVHGNHYAIQKASIVRLLKDGYFPIKEVHPANFAKLRARFPDALTIVLEGDARSAERDDRSGKDELTLRDLKDDAAQVFINTVGMKPQATAEHIRLCVHTLSQFRQRYPDPTRVDAISATGYAAVASTFDDASRPTTAAFHSASSSFWNSAALEFLNGAERIIEVCSGRGWLRRTVTNAVKIPWIEVDACAAMVETSARKPANTRRIVGTARRLPFGAQSCQVVVGSLVDSILYPTVFLEIARILKDQGFFIFTSPTNVFARLVRTNRDIDMTSFKLATALRPARVFSFCRPLDDLLTLSSAVGFGVKSLTPIYYRPRTGRAPPVLEEMSEKCGIAVEHIPVLYGVVLQRSVERLSM